MHRKSLICATILLAAAAFAKEPKAYMSGTLMQMDSVKCGTEEKDAKSVTGEILGTDSSHRKTEELLCQEYVLQAEKTVYRIRPRDEKHPVLLPVGETAQFRLEKNKMMLRVETVDPKEHEYIVVTMTPRSESTADATPAKVNHLQ